MHFQRNLRMKFGQKRKKYLITGLNKGSAKCSANIYGSAEPPKSGNQIFGSAEPNIRSKQCKKVRSNRIFGRTLTLRFGRIRIFGAPLAPSAIFWKKFQIPITVQGKWTTNNINFYRIQSFC